MMRTKVPNVDSLLIVVVTSRDSLLERTRARGHFGAVEAWDRPKGLPARNLPTYKFRNHNLEEFNTNYYVLTELLNSRVHPFRKRFLSNIFPEILGQVIDRNVASISHEKPPQHKKLKQAVSELRCLPI